MLSYFHFLLRRFSFRRDGAQPATDLFVRRFELIWQIQSAVFEVTRKEIMSSVQVILTPIMK